ncbi:MAG: type III-B CRISPR module RAMP protein Cmr6 [Deltaproteobacteria bacterium]|nr:type III-B CRISPR module RAMP protein Cmr6 [Deltaproteobacteria bacterium]
MYVVPKFQSDLLHAGTRGNFGLFFSRMTQWRITGANIKAEFQAGIQQNNSKPIMDSSIVELGNRSQTMLPAAASALQALHRRQKTVLDQARQEGRPALEIRASLQTPFVSGLGSGHPTETGFILDRNTGVPYLPASAVKGVLRLAQAVNLTRSGQAEAWMHKGRLDDKGRFHHDEHGNQWELDDREPSLRKYFGDTDTGAEDGVRGQLVFLDAYPEQIPVLKPDIMNPHYHKYYGASTPQEKETGPVDCEDPIPVKFLSVPEGTVFVFRVLASPLAKPVKEERQAVERTFGPEDETSVREMFDTAFTELGFGGKTAVGYGRFALAEASTVSGGSSADPHGTPGTAAPSVLASAEDIIWENAILKWDRGSGTLTAEHEGKKAQSKDKSLVPEQHEKVFGKKLKKPVQARVTVRVTGNLFEILKIE